VHAKAAPKPEVWVLPRRKHAQTAAATAFVTPITQPTDGEPPNTRTHTLQFATFAADATAADATTAARSTSTSTAAAFAVAAAAMVSLITRSRRRCRRLRRLKQQHGKLAMPQRVTRRRRPPRADE
jgi:hypothetical protein